MGRIDQCVGVTRQRACRYAIPWLESALEMTPMSHSRRGFLSRASETSAIALTAFLAGFAAIAAAGLAQGAQSGSESTSANRPPAAHSPVGLAACSAVALPTLGGPGGNVIAAGGNRIYVGIADDVTGVSRPVIWRSGHVQRLPIGLESATPTAVNQQGLVVGTGFDPARQILVGWWWAGGRAGTLDVRSGDIAQPTAIDDAGHIVGSLIADDEHADGPGADESARAAYWSSIKALPTELPALPGDSSAEAFALAPDGTVGGVSLGSGGSPVLWTPNGQVHRLPGLAGKYGIVLGFDDRSEPVGQSSVPGGTEAVAWSRSGVPTDLGADLGVQSQAVAGAAGVVVGSGSATVNGAAARDQGVIWFDGDARLLSPVSVNGFHGVEGTANAVTTTGAHATVVVGFSAEPLGLRRPTEWRCTP